MLKMNLLTAKMYIYCRCIPKWNNNIGHILKHEWNSMYSYEMAISLPWDCVEKSQSRANKSTTKQVYFFFKTVHHFSLRVAHTSPNTHNKCTKRWQPSVFFSEWNLSYAVWPSHKNKHKQPRGSEVVVIYTSLRESARSIKTNTSRRVCNSPFLPHIHVHQQISLRFISKCWHSHRWIVELMAVLWRRHLTITITPTVCMKTWLPIRIRCFLVMFLA